MTAVTIPLPRFVRRWADRILERACGLWES